MKKVNKKSKREKHKTITVEEARQLVSNCDTPLVRLLLEKVKGAAIYGHDSFILEETKAFNSYFIEQACSILKARGFLCETKKDNKNLKDGDIFVCW